MKVSAIVGHKEKRYPRIKIFIIKVILFQQLEFLNHFMANSFLILATVGRFSKKLFYVHIYMMYINEYAVETYLESYWVLLFSIFVRPTRLTFLMIYFETKSWLLYYRHINREIKYPNTIAHFESDHY